MDRAKLQAGERVLVHGGAGSVGLLAVQLACFHGAHVIATASADNLDFVKLLGANEVIDYRASRFENQAGKVDIVFDTVGSETLNRSWSVLKPGGRMVTIVGEDATEQRVKEAFFIVEPNQNQLTEVANLLDAGTLKTFVSAVVSLEDASAAYEGTLEHKRRYGKVVVAIPE